MSEVRYGNKAEKGSHIFNQFCRVQKYISQRGLWATVALVLAKAVSPLFSTRTVIITASNLNEPIREVIPKGGVELRVLEDYESTKKTDLSRFFGDDELKRRFRRGLVVGVALEGESVVSYLWFNPGPTHFLKELGLNMLLSPGQCVTYDGLTLEEWRGKDIYPAVICLDLRWAKARGFHTRFGYIVTSNKGAIRASAKAGVMELCRIRWTRISKLNIWWFGPKRLDIPVDFAPPAQPERGQGKLLGKKMLLSWKGI